VKREHECRLLIATVRLRVALACHSVKLEGETYSSEGGGEVVRRPMNGAVGRLPWDLLVT
jgi:hypothetical protein